jgi:CRP-like cAMP-binding protein
MAANVPIELVRDVALFRGMTSEETWQVLDAAEDLDYAAGQAIFHEAGPDRALYLLVDGQVEIVLPLPGSGETIVARLEAGAVFGEASFFHGTPHVATARCLTPVLAIRLARTAYDQMLRAGSLPAYKVAANAADILAGRLQATDRWVADLVHQQQDAAIAASWRAFRERLGVSFAPLPSLIRY